MTGSMPGIAASTSDTCEFGSPPNSVEAPENSFDFEVTWAWTSIPITTSQPPSAPLISFDVFAALLMSLPGQHSGAFMEAHWRGCNGVFGREKASPQIEVPAQGLFRDVDGVDEFLEFNDLAVAQPHDVGEPKIENAAGHVMLESHFRHDRGTIAV